jgi:hypothetical protein
VGGLPAGGADQRAVGQHDRQRRGVGSDEPVLLPTPPPSANVAEPEPFEAAECRWIGAQLVQEPQILFSERPEREVVVHAQIVLQNAILSARPRTLTTVAGGAR